MNRPVRRTVPYGYPHTARAIHTVPVPLCRALTDDWFGQLEEGTAPNEQEILNLDDSKPEAERSEGSGSGA